MKAVQCKTEYCSIRNRAGRLLSIICCAVILCTVLGIPLKTFAETEGTGKTVKIGWYQSDLFQEGMSDDEVKSGYCYEYICKISDYNNWKYEYVYGNWTELYEKLLSGEIDVLAGVSKTEERLDKILYPDEVMGYEHYVLYQHEGGDMDSSDLSTFKGKKIGAITDNLMTDYLESWVSRNNADVEIVYYDSFGDRDKDFDDGTIDALVTTNNGVKASSGYAQVVEVGKESYYLAVTKDRKDLLAELNTAQVYMENIEPYFITNLEYKNYGTTLANSTLSNIEEEWLSAHDTITIGYLDHYLPYCATDSDGNAYGLITDVIQAIEDELNIADRLTVVYKAYASSGELTEAVKNGDIDAVFPVSGDNWQLEQSGIDATNAVVTASENLVYSGKYSEEKLKRIAVAEGNEMSTNYVMTVFPDAEIVKCENIQGCLKAVLSGSADSTIINSLRTDLVKHNREYSSLSLKRLIKTDERSIGVAADNNALLMLLNRGLMLIGDNFGSNTAFNYMSELYEDTVWDFLYDHAWFVVLAVVIFILLIVAFFVNDRRKNAKILNIETERNNELTAMNQKQNSQLEKITSLNEKLRSEQEEKDRYNSVIGALSKAFLNIYILNPNSRTVRIVKLDGYVTSGMDKSIPVTYDYETACRRYIADRVYEDDKRMVTDAMTLEQVIKGTENGTEYEFTYRVLEGGEIHFYQGSYNKIDSNVIVAGFRNADALVAAEESRNRQLKDHIAEVTMLVDSLTEYSDIITSAGYGIWHITIKNGSRPRMRLNEKMAQMLSMDNVIMSEEDTCDSWFDRINPEDVPAVQESLKKMSDGSFSEVTYLWNHPEKGPIYVRCGGTAMTLEDGSLMFRGYHSDVTDIVIQEQTQRQRLEESLKQLQEEDDIIRSAGHGIWRCPIGPDGRITGMIGNDEWKRIFGVEDTEMSPEECLLYFVNGLSDKSQDPRNYVYSNLKPGLIMRMTFGWNHPAKGLLYIEIAGTHHIDQNGEIQVSGYAADVTDQTIAKQKWEKDLIEARAAAEASNRAKTSFLFNMSHDIRTPMNAILGYTELIEKHLDDKPLCHEYFGKLRSSGNFLLSLINNVLEMARVESGKAVLEEEQYEIKALAGEIADVYSELMKGKNITFTQNIDVNTDCIYMDHVKLSEIFLNIVSNAYKYTPVGGRVEMTVRELPCDKAGFTTIQTTVKDTGIGMSKDYLPTIFEEFSREHTSRETKIQGTGLGMPIVKKLVDLMGGTIAVESEPGKGSTFTVTISHRIAETQNPQNDDSVAASEIDFEGMRLLLAEDNDLNAEIAGEVLGEVGFELDRAEDGRICVDKLMKAPCGYYDAILMDIQMPNMNGYEAARTIRSMNDPGRSNIPIIAMTANAFDSDKQDAAAAGMNGHVAKPIDVPVLLKTLSGILRK